MVGLLAVLLILVLWIAPIVVGTLVGSHMGRPVIGLLLGLVTSWLGVIVAAVLPPTDEELIRRERQRQEIAAQVAWQMRQQSLWRYQSPSWADHAQQQPPAP